jgi:hypothetical protein
MGHTDNGGQNDKQLLDTMPNMELNLLDLTILNSFTLMTLCGAKMTQT